MSTTETPLARDEALEHAWKERTDEAYLRLAAEAGVSPAEWTARFDGDTAAAGRALARRLVRHRGGHSLSAAIAGPVDRIVRAMRVAAQRGQDSTRVALADVLRVRRWAIDPAFFGHLADAVGSVDPGGTLVAQRYTRRDLSLLRLLLDSAAGHHHDAVELWSADLLSSVDPAVLVMRRVAPGVDDHLGEAQDDNELPVAVSSGPHPIDGSAVVVRPVLDGRPDSVAADAVVAVGSGPARMVGDEAALTGAGVCAVAVGGDASAVMAERPLRGVTADAVIVHEGEVDRVGPAATRAGASAVVLEAASEVGAGQGVVVCEDDLVGQVLRVANAVGQAALAGREPTPVVVVRSDVAGPLADEVGSWPTVPCGVGSGRAHGEELTIAARALRGSEHQLARLLREVGPPTADARGGLWEDAAEVGIDLDLWLIARIGSSIDDSFAEFIQLIGLRRGWVPLPADLVAAVDTAITEAWGCVARRRACAAPTLAQLDELAAAPGTWAQLANGVIVSPHGVVRPFEEADIDLLRAIVAHRGDGSGVARDIGPLRVAVLEGLHIEGET